IADNPKWGAPPVAMSKDPDGRLTAGWRRRCAEYYRRIIPAHVPAGRVIFLTTPEELAQFVSELRQEKIDVSEVEYVCIVEPIANLYDIVEFLSLLRDRLPAHAKLITANFNWLMSPLFKVASSLGVSRRGPFNNFCRDKDLLSFFDMSGWECSKEVRRYILPVPVPVIGKLIDDFFIQLPYMNVLRASAFFVARKKGSATHAQHFSVSILIPCRNEEGNIRAAVVRTPDFGSSVEFVFINDKSTDGTEQEIKKCQREFPGRKIVLVQGEGKGKGQAVREGMKHATGDICMILDADLTVIPEDLPQFYDAMRFRWADFIHGTRLVYAQEGQAMRAANIVGNVFFSHLFSYILQVRTTDTLCGTKVFWRRDWPLFQEARQLLENADVWGDYDLIFGASHFGLKVSQLPVRYFERLEGVTKMNKRIKNGLVMLRVSALALSKFRFKS
ncbi:MAG TPA: glycosyltransferase family 2 protein, partial [Polyangiales bacterium]|nr:glycosyltransferase family 2 protein [Polyangiales bacterium]